MRPLVRAALATASLAALLALAERDARACGGCFHPPTENDSIITDHRMILSVSSKQTTLWDQIRYQGNPSSFAWVLPVSDANVATLGLSADIVFDALDTLTGTEVQAPNPPSCPAPPDGCGGAGSLGAGSSGSSSGGGAPPVDVTKHEVVGPYDVAFLHSTDPNALNTWLTDHGYAIPADVAPIVAAYVNEHYDFIAMKLVPGAGVSAMRPVRVSTPGAAPVLPLRMVSAGTGPIVSITLWVLGEGKWEPQNFGFFTITSDQITWDFGTETSNYATLRDGQNAATHNTQWEMESSLALQVQQLDALVQYGGTPYPNSFYDAGTDYEGIDPSDGGPDAETPDQVRDDDLATLVAGMDVNNLRVTRIRSDLAHTSLTSDLVLQASQDQSILSNVRTPTKYSNPPQCPTYQGCQPVSGGSSGSGSGSSSGSPTPYASNDAPSSKSSFSCASSPTPARNALALLVTTVLGLAAMIARSRKRR